MTGWEHQLVWLFAGVGGLLMLATLVSILLQRRHPPGAASPTVENLRARVIAWWVMVGLISAAFLGGRTGVMLLFALCSFGALREFTTLRRVRRADHWATAAAFFVVLPLHYYLVWIDWYGVYAIFIPVYAFLLLPVVAVVRGDNRNFLDRIAETQWALMTCVYCVSHVPALLYLSIPGFEGANVLLIAFLIFVVQLSDVLQYVWGKLLGRTRIAPNVSPSKTVEGTVGGILSASAVGACLWWMTPFTMVEAGLLSLAITVMGFLGGLVMSSIKRDCGVKDWGNLIPGHGGFIDRLDSVIFSAPIFFHLVRYGWSLS